MKEFEYKITDDAGLHARPAGLLVKEAKKYSSRITVNANGKECDATRLMALMAMCVKSDTIVKITVDGEDEEICAAELEKFFKENL
ncbi:MAG: HPr family phosphocarrier protein [Ruminococcus sp.]|nr:HPr family phosphocarrier protein [Candidatus Copronaster equi]